MPKELPGFYYDAEKNRYFPIKGPIPGSSRTHARSALNPVQNPLSNPTQPTKSSWTGERTSKLLQVRELNGNVMSFTKGKRNFKEEFQKRLASQPVVVEYRGTNKIADAALQQIRVDIDALEGQTETDVLLAGSISGSLSVFEVGKVGSRFDNGVNFIPDRAWPRVKENKADRYKAPDPIWRTEGASIVMPSGVSCLKLPRKNSSCTTDEYSNCRHVVLTTLGSSTSGGAIHVLNLDDPFEFRPMMSALRERIHEVTSFNCTMWTADCNYNASEAVVGTSLGAAVVNLETGKTSWVCRGASDILAQQLDQSGNVVLCGLRNGAIVMVDVRERQQGSSTRLIRHRIPYSPSQKTGQNSKKQWFQLRGNISTSRITFMPSSISSLVSLRFYDQYFLASAMDGSVKLYDQRQTERGPVQSYEGHVNSHTRIQLAVDQSERFVMSGGEDCNVRLWSIKSGELLFDEKVCHSVPSTMCWRKFDWSDELENEKEIQTEYQLGESHSWEAWFGTPEGLFNMRWP